MFTFFNFSRGEWAATVFMALIIILSFLFYYLYDKRPNETFDTSQYQQEIESFLQEQKYLADSVALAKQQRQVWYEERNQRKGYANTNRTTWSTFPDDSTKRQPKARGYEIVKIDINSCDTSDIVVIPLFGSKRAAKLVEYREQLGGFHSFKQLNEVYVMQSIPIDHIAKYFVITPHKINKIRINHATYKELIAHPYFDAYLTKMIINHREKKGAIHNLDELVEITHIYPELLEKLKPYLSFEE